ncbi:hypothetical protein B0T21DRAFT_95908 [Apiosordaria backusii]|uniref:Uncharacterized protein n=1 Tax=Apiosordaria backusii TaxID=314023 RepID=A0AA40ET47_9PEZI|nr:hypothetical protein B0T21DRAFT_95908 [Apiosordaria backusii]
MRASCSTGVFFRLLADSCASPLVFQKDPKLPKLKPATYRGRVKHRHDITRDVVVVSVVTWAEIPPKTPSYVNSKVDVLATQDSIDQSLKD